ncbi:MAG: ABC transporter substrate-binding protein [Pseudomonadota bacterium]|nr:ABC transporter substrate-binding protein [Pseudomonadota bacterium]
MTRIGALIPATAPGWVEAGEQLLAGLELGVEWVNERRDLLDHPVELIVRDTAADASRAVAIVNELAADGISALAGEYHSVVAGAVAKRAAELALPFLCSSAVLDNLTDGPTDHVARIAPAQSRGWRVYADYLLEAGHRRIAVAKQSNIYWETGTQILTTHLASKGAELVQFDLDALSAADLPTHLADDGATALLVLTGFPEPATSIVRAIRSDARLDHVKIGTPAGQSEFAQWTDLLGQEGVGIPFLSYMPKSLPAFGKQISDALHARLGSPPSFVALEGFDTVLALADALRRKAGGDGPLWANVDIQGTRGRITFAKVPSIPIWQWAWPPIAVAERPRDGDAELRISYRPESVSGTY